jgi:hypothetical protein
MGGTTYQLRPGFLSLGTTPARASDDLPLPDAPMTSANRGAPLLAI